MKWADKPANRFPFAGEIRIFIGLGEEPHAFDLQGFTDIVKVDAECGQRIKELLVIGIVGTLTLFAYFFMRRSGSTAA